ncbi:MAG: 50S ribosomal protein L24 [archaeon]|nr:50S ribosomal protein L24 [archaeon]
MTSSKSRIQRKSQINAPTHIAGKKLSAHLSESLQSQFNRRTARICTGDTVTVLRGAKNIRGTEGKVVKVSTTDGRVAIDGVTINQADGTAVARPIHASNVVITKLNLNDTWRKNMLSRKGGLDSE